jgi:CubicO group peptidase (beta-lactamase class C family)
MPGYLNQTFGYVLGELCRRVNGGRRWAKFLGDEIANPFGIDWLFCVPVSEVGRLATIYSNKPDKVPETESAGSTPFGLSMKGSDPGQDYNSHAWRSAEQGSGTSHCNARAMARLYGGLACEGALNGKQLISADTLRVAQTEAIAGYDPVIGTEMRYSTGFEMSTKTATPMGPSRRAFGYVGAGGAFSFADPDTRLGFGYTPNFMHAGYGPGPCGLPLVEAANESVRKL